MRNFLAALFPALLLATLSGCGGSSTSGGGPIINRSLRLSASPSTIDLKHDGTPVSVTVTATCENVDTVSVTVTGLPAGVATNGTQPTCTTPGTIQFSVGDASNAPATTYTASIGSSSFSGTLSANISVNIQAQASATTTPTGATTAFMSTSFQLADWSYMWLHDHPDTIPPLVQLQDQHIRIQLIDGAVPQLDANTWDFTKADEMIQPLLYYGDKSPQLQIGTVPAFLADANGHYIEANLAQFAAYCANLVRYYNTGGFTVNGTLYKSPSSTPITWWGIFNEPNWNSVTPAQYVTMYNAVAQAMLAVDPTIKLVGLEVGDTPGMAQSFLPPLIAGVTQPMHALASHYYSSCNQKDTDAQLFAQVKMFHDQIAYIRTTMDANVSANGTPIWITENNVNADYDKGNGVSACTGGPYTADVRGTSPYFAAWRPYVYSQMVQAGAAGIWHWSFYGGTQYGEYADDSTAYLSYYVDFMLSHLYGQSSMEVISSTVTEPNRLEVFAAQDPYGKRVIMVVNRDVAGSTDNNGPGVPKTVLLDLNNLGTYTTVRLTAIDKNTGPYGPGTTEVIPTNGILPLTFPGYGVQFIEVGYW